MQRSGLPMVIAALGIVFGDIGTSPMYALEASIQSPGLPAGNVSIFGVASLIFWTLNLIVSIKYLLFITHVDNDGEGGIFAITSVLKDKLTSGVGQAVLVGLIVISAALLFADSLITPPLSIMAAVEGIEIIDPEAADFVIPGSLAVILLLFGAQRFGTQMLSAVFSPIMLTWFAVIGVLGLVQVLHHPEILMAISPVYAVELVSALTWQQVFALFGSILLAATGAEAIYADMGHFSRKPISIAWYLIAMGSLMLNYFGQSAWLLDNGSASANPFFALVPQAHMIPMVILATLASIIASQAVISGMFSIANQAIRQGYLPRLRIVQTSEAVRGQIYIPLVNTMLLIGAVLLIIGFGSSAALASSYGFAVSATMLLTTLAFTLVVLMVWKWSALKVVAFVFFALPLDLMFMAATVTKLPSGHYMTLIVTVSVAWAMLAWYVGNRFLAERAQRIDIPVEDFSEVAGLRTGLHRQNRAAVFFQHLPFPSDVRVTPFALLQHVQVTSMLYQPTVIVEFLSSSLPRVTVNDRISFYEYPHGIILVHVTFGFWEVWSMDPVVKLGVERGWWAKEEDIVYYAAREDLRFSRVNGLPLALKLPYAFLHRFDQRILRQVKLDRARCVELGAAVEI